MRERFLLLLNRRLNLRGLRLYCENALSLICTCELRPAANWIYVNKYFTGETMSRSEQQKEQERERESS